MNKTLITCVVIICGIYMIWYLGFHKPLSARTTDLTNNIKVEERKLRAYSIALAEIESKRYEYDSVCTALGLGEVAFSGDHEVILLYKTIDSLCHRPGYELEEITPSLNEVIHFLRKWESAEARVYIPIHIKIKGKYISLTSLIEDIECNTYFDHLSETRITGSDELYPECRMDIAFVAGLNNRLGILEIE
ncbi:MAG: hypothetical protein KAR42_09725 [candidate division Zixibacteria bacterium]|nr:hypothetical protein [candidate division Zixibacteria bacterium]